MPDAVWDWQWLQQTVLPFSPDLIRSATVAVLAKLAYILRDIWPEELAGNKLIGHFPPWVSCNERVVYGLN